MPFAMISPTWTLGVAIVMVSKKVLATTAGLTFVYLITR